MPSASFVTPNTVRIDEARQALCRAVDDYLNGDTRVQRWAIEREARRLVAACDAHRGLR